MLTNASVEDVSQTLAGIVAFAPLLFVTGYLINRATAVLTRRNESLADTLGASLALSISILPVLLHLIGRISMAGTGVIFWASAATFLVMLWRKRRAIVTAANDRAIQQCLLIALIWAAISIPLQIDWEWNGRVYPPGIADQAFRIGTISALDRSRVLPPEDPFLRLGRVLPLGYHYFWYILCDLVSRAAPRWIGTRGSLMAGTAWTGLALWASLSLWLKGVRAERDWTRIRWTVAAMLLCISGLDILPASILALRRIMWHSHQWIPISNLDSWSPDPLVNWLGTMLWVPHCAASLVACTTGLLILVNCADRDTKARTISAVLAGACFASAVGMSVYVAFGFVIAIGLYTIFLAVRRDWRTALPIITSGVVALLLVTPFLGELRTNVASPGFLHAGVRILPLDLLPKTFRAIAAGSLRHLVYLPGLAITLFLEFGFWILAAIYWTRQRSDRDPIRKALFAFLIFPSVTLISLFRSDLTNDLGMRAIFTAQFAMALMAGEWFLRLLPKPDIGSVLSQTAALPRFVFILLILGVSTTVADAALWRSYLMIQDLDIVDSRFIEWSNVGSSMASIRTAYEWVKAHSLPDAVVQIAPSNSALFFAGAYADRQTIVTGPYQFGYRVKYKPELDTAMNDVLKIFSDEGQPSATVASVCSRWEINYVIVTSHDPVWANPESWVWHAPVIYQNAMARVYSCLALR